MYLNSEIRRVTGPFYVQVIDESISCLLYILVQSVGGVILIVFTFDGTNTRHCIS